MKFAQTGDSWKVDEEMAEPKGELHFTRKSY
jgi:hypothetical protein